MNSMLKVAGVAVLALAVGVTILPRGPDIGAAPAPSASPATEPAPLRAGSLPAGTYSVAPFVPPDEWTLCMEPPQPGCIETASDDAITFTFTVPEGWEGAPFKTIWLADEMNAAARRRRPGLQPGWLAVQRSLPLDVLAPHAGHPGRPERGRVRRRAR